jgi:hypothetical protein
MIKKDARRTHKNENQIRLWQKRTKLIFIVVLIMVASLGGSLFYVYHHASQHMQIMTNWTAPIRTWISTRKENLNQNITRIKKVAENRMDTHPPIRFEFYNTLPGMKVNVPEHIESVVKVSEKMISPETPKMMPPEVKSLRIFDAEQLQRSLNAELAKQEINDIHSRQTFILLLGTFKKNESAERLHQKLLTLGFSVKLISTQINGNTWYRVQVGPYQNREQAVIAQQKLKSQHLNSLLRQTTQSKSEIKNDI